MDKNSDFLTGLDEFNARMKQRFTEQHDKIDDLKNSNVKLTLKVQSHEAKISELENEKKRINEELATKSTECAELVKSNEILISEVKSCKENISLLEQQKKDLEKQLTEKTVECVELAKSNEKLNFNIVGFQVGNQAHGEKISNLEKENQRLSSELQSRDKSFFDQFEKLQKQHTSEITTLQKEFKMVQSHFEEKAAECEQLKVSNQSLTSDRASDREKILKLLTELEAMKEKESHKENIEPASDKNQNSLKRKSTKVLDLESDDPKEYEMYESTEEADESDSHEEHHRVISLKQYSKLPNVQKCRK